MILSGALEQKVSKLATVAGFHLLNIQQTSTKGPTKITVVIDRETAFSIDDCGEFSRKVAALLDEQESLNQRYVLEVTSPGADAPLKEVFQYRKNIGRQLKVLLTDGTEKQGILKSVTDLQLVIDSIPKKKSEISVSEHIDFVSIKKAQVVLSFK